MTAALDILRKRLALDALAELRPGEFVAQVDLAGLAEFLGVSPVLGPLIGAAAAGLIAGDPRRIIWKAKDATAVAVPAPATSEAVPEAA